MSVWCPGSNAPANRLRVAPQLCLPPPLKVPPFARLVPRLPPRSPAALPRAARPPRPAVWLRSIMPGASGPRCRRRNTARRFAPRRASHRCSGRSHAGLARAARLGSLVLESSGPHTLLASRPYAAPSVGGLRPLGWGFRCPRIAPGRCGLAAIPPKLPPSRRPAAAAEQCLPPLQSPPTRGQPRPPVLIAGQARGEQLLRASLGRCAVSVPSLFPDGIPALFLLYRTT